MGVKWPLVALLLIPRVAMPEEGAFQALPGQLQERRPPLKVPPEAPPTPFLPGMSSQGLERKAPKEKSPFLGHGPHDQFEGQTDHDRMTSVDSAGVGDISQFEQGSPQEFLKGVQDRGNLLFSLSYIHDRYEYADDKKIFERTYKTGPKSIHVGTLFVKMGRKFWGLFTLGGGIGVSHYQGRGLFVDGTRSLATFQFWAIPLELELGLRYNLGPFLGLSATAGPGGMIITEARDDKERSDPEQKKLQTGRGYHATASVAVGLSSIVPGLGASLYSSYGVTRMGLELYGRFQDYRYFSDKGLFIKGASFGGGVTFEFL